MTVRHLSQEDLAERWGIPAESVKRQRRLADHPPYIRLGKYVRYRESDVEAWERKRLKTA